jgi:hypothetical protein
MVKSGVTWGKIRTAQDTILNMLFELDHDMTALSAPPDELIALSIVRLYEESPV